ncbi:MULTISPECIES: acetoin utilization protein acuB [unclassified Zunongwangia]|uniref:acetoin utilization protein acuB n=1 Tax=unclassified Zunongwangia TaxID=2632541 RepID=UPI0022DCE906|nr:MULTISPECIES: acetoin utilization protein acuB [unclassified Zunongwangia]WBL21981.1 acetoin utilization protein acuB [Zunongwangia sp. HRR-M8]WBL26066.1 acetoin utilization protein acuB [Zunongwangia sp. HGR-M22]
MNMEEYILNDVSIRHFTDKIGEVQKDFNQLTYSHLPVENNGLYMGCISENDIRCFDAEKSIEDYQYALEGFFVRNTDYWLDVLETFAQNDSNILPVLDNENEYLGYIELNEIMGIFNETPFLNEAGNIIVVEKGFKDYSLSEISQIIESSNVHLLGLFVSKIENDLAQITIKINPTGITEVIQSLRRYGYSIISQHQEDSFNKNLRERSKYLDKYLNI